MLCFYHTGLMTESFSVAIATSDSPWYDNFTMPASRATFLTSNEDHYLFSDKDIAAYLDFYKYNIDANLLIPYDGLGDEYMTLTSNVNDSDLYCELLGQDGKFDVWIFRKTGDREFKEGVRNLVVNLTDGDQTGTVFKSASGKPFAVFCGSLGGAYFGPSLNQLPPVNTWGTAHVTPVVGEIPNSSIKVKLKIVTNANNNLLEIRGDFDSVHTLDYRGDWIEIDINGSVSYTITSSQPVLVSMHLYDISNPIDSAFKILPATENFEESPLLHLYSLVPNPSEAGSSTESITVTTKTGEHTTTFLPDLGDAYLYAHVANDSTAFTFALLLTGSNVRLVPSTSLHRDLTEV